MKNETFYSNAKLLITGEYVVLDGSRALAVPLRVGQKMEVFENDSSLLWKSFDKDGKLWFEAEFDSCKDFEEIFSSENKISETLRQILQQTRKLNPSFLQNQGAEVHNHLNFDKDWGLGTSSTLINNLAQWAQVNAFDLQQNTFGGSGYDIASAAFDTPIIYSKNNNTIDIQPITLDWPFAGELFLVYLNKKQNSREAINHYRQLPKMSHEIIRQFSELTLKFISSTTLHDFEKLVDTHEALLGDILKLQTVKHKFFSDYPGSIKSLGAWGGDFVLATRKDALRYFPEKGFTTVIPYQEIAK